jgi:hypothetical protein
VTLGLKGEITVNGQKYNNVMVALPAKYTDADAAAVITYVYNSWGNTGPTVTERKSKKSAEKQKRNNNDFVLNRYCIPHSVMSGGFFLVNADYYSLSSS